MGRCFFARLNAIENGHERKANPPNNRIKPTPRRAALRTTKTFSAARLMRAVMPQFPMPALTFGSLFSGIGGFDLGLERAGMVCKWQVEIDDYCQRVLSKHWPAVPKYGDITKIEWSTVEKVEVIAGGFPCQPHSLSGKRKGSADERDLWGECVRCLGELRPRYALFENVPGLFTSERGRFFNRVVSDLAACGYDAEWQVLSASAFGASHIRERVFILAYSNWNHSANGRQCEILQIENRARGNDRRGSNGHFREVPIRETRQVKKDMAHVDGERQQERRGPVSIQTQQPGAECGGENVSNAPSGREQSAGTQRDERGFQVEVVSSIWHPDYWKVEPAVGRVADGIPGRVDRLRALGNAIVPQVAEYVGQCVVRHNTALQATSLRFASGSS